MSGPSASASSSYQQQQQHHSDVTHHPNYIVIEQTSAAASVGGGAFDPTALGQTDGPQFVPQHQQAAIVRKSYEQQKSVPVKQPKLTFQQQIIPQQMLQQQQQHQQASAPQKITVPRNVQVMTTKFQSTTNAMNPPPPSVAAVNQQQQQSMIICRTSSPSTTLGVQSHYVDGSVAGAGYSTMKTVYVNNSTAFMRPNRSPSYSKEYKATVVSASSPQIIQHQQQQQQKVTSMTTSKNYNNNCSVKNVNVINAAPGVQQQPPPQQQPPQATYIYQSQPSLPTKAAGLPPPQPIYHISETSHKAMKSKQAQFMQEQRTTATYLPVTSKATLNRGSGGGGSSVPTKYAVTYANNYQPTAPAPITGRNQQASVISYSEPTSVIQAPIKMGGTIYHEIIDEAHIVGNHHANAARENASPSTAIAPSAAQTASENFVIVNGTKITDEMSARLLAGFSQKAMERSYQATATPSVSAAAAAAAAAKEVLIPTSGAASGEQQQMHLETYNMYPRPTAVGEEPPKPTQIIYHHHNSVDAGGQTQRVTIVQEAVPKDEAPQHSHHHQQQQQQQQQQPPLFYHRRSSESGYISSPINQEYQIASDLKMGTERIIYQRTASASASAVPLIEYASHLHQQQQQHQQHQQQRQDEDVVGVEVRPLPPPASPEGKSAILHAVLQDHTYFAAATVTVASSSSAPSTIGAASSSTSGARQSATFAHQQQSMSHHHHHQHHAQQHHGLMGPLTASDMFSNPHLEANTVAAAAVLSSMPGAVKYAARAAAAVVRDDDVHSTISNGSHTGLNLADMDPGEETETAEEQGDDDSETRCICNLTHDDGYMICCDTCSTWQHVDCMQIDRQNIPEEYQCVRCAPREVDYDRARTLQQLKKREQDQANSFSSGATIFDGVSRGGSSSTSKITGTPDRKTPSLKRQKSGSSVSSTTSKKRSEATPFKKKRGEARSNGKRREMKRATKRKASKSTDTPPPAQETKLNSTLRNWIENYEQAVTNHYSPELRARLQALNKQPGGVDASPAPLQSVSLSAAHPRCTIVPHAGAKILISTEELDPGTPVVEIMGKYMLDVQQRQQVLSKSEKPYAEGPFLFFYKAGGSLEICVDTRTYGNEARFVRRSCRANAELLHSIEKNVVHLYIVARARILPGAEITIPHGGSLEPQSTMCHTPTPCACGMLRDCIFSAGAAGSGLATAGVVSPVSSVAPGAVLFPPSMLRRKNGSHVPEKRKYKKRKEKTKETTGRGRGRSTSSSCESNTGMLSPPLKVFDQPSPLTPVSHMPISLPSSIEQIIESVVSEEEVVRNEEVAVELPPPPAPLLPLPDPEPTTTATTAAAAAPIAEEEIIEQIPPKAATPPPPPTPVAIEEKEPPPPPAPAAVVQSPPPKPVTSKRGSRSNRNSVTEHNTSSEEVTKDETDAGGEKDKGEKRKLTREERKMEAIVRAFEKMEKNQQRKQEAKKGGSTPSKKRSKSPSAAAKQRTVSVAAMKRKMMTQKRKKRKSSSAVSTAASRKKPPVESDASDAAMTSSEESRHNMMTSPQQPLNYSTAPSCGDPNALLLAYKPDAEETNLSHIPPLISSACMFVEAAVAPLEQASAAESDQFKYPPKTKTKKTIINDWMLQGGVTADPTAGYASEAIKSEFHAYETDIGLVAKKVEEFICLQGETDDAGAAAAAAVAATAGVKQELKLTTTPPTAVSPAGDSSAANTQLGMESAVKKRWLRQAISEETADELSAAAATAVNVITPLKKRRAIIEQMDEVAVTPPPANPVIVTAAGSLDLSVKPEVMATPPPQPPCEEVVKDEDVDVVDEIKEELEEFKEEAETEEEELVKLEPIPTPMPVPKVVPKEEDAPPDEIEEIQKKLASFHSENIQQLALRNRKAKNPSIGSEAGVEDLLPPAAASAIEESPPTPVPSPTVVAAAAPPRVSRFSDAPPVPLPPPEAIYDVPESLIPAPAVNYQPAPAEYRTSFTYRPLMTNLDYLDATPVFAQSYNKATLLPPGVGYVTDVPGPPYRSFSTGAELPPTTVTCGSVLASALTGGGTPTVVSTVPVVAASSTYPKIFTKTASSDPRLNPNLAAAAAAEDAKAEKPVPKKKLSLTEYRKRKQSKSTDTPFEVERKASCESPTSNKSANTSVNSSPTREESEIDEIKLALREDSSGGATFNPVPTLAEQQRENFSERLRSYKTFLPTAAAPAPGGGSTNPSSSSPPTPPQQAVAVSTVAAATVTTTIAAADTTRPEAADSSTQDVA